MDATPKIHECIFDSSNSLEPILLIMHEEIFVQKRTNSDTVV